MNWEMKKMKIMIPELRKFGESKNENNKLDEPIKITING